MSQWVLAVSIGPVAHFVAAGRRSRDLWYGSFWVSETTRHVAEEFRKPGVELLLPSPARLDRISAQARAKAFLFRAGRVSNKVLALVSIDDDTKAQETLSSLAKRGRDAAIGFLAGELEALEGHKRLHSLLDHEAFQRQIDAIREGDFIEYAAAWARHESEADVFFGGTVKRACDLRDAHPKYFGHPVFTREGVERSHLDEGRDTVLVRRNDSVEHRKASLRAGILDSEELDAVGLLRRASPYLHTGVGEVVPRLPFPPLSRVAAHPWIEGLTRESKTQRALDGVLDVLRGARGSDDFNLWCSYSREPGFRPDENEETFPYDASVLFEGGVEAAQRRIERFDASLPNVAGPVRQLHRVAGYPVQYYAYVELDGDRVGSLLAAMKSQPDYQTLVECLDSFADQAADTIEWHDGVAFYVAGDELTAYLPVDRAIDLVRKLDDLYRQSLQRFRKTPNLPALPPELQHDTVSAGVVIAHVKDDLRGVRERARHALRHAKKKASQSEQVTSAKSNGHVCIVEMPRGGVERGMCGSIAEIANRITTWCEGLRMSDVSLRTEQILRDHAARFGFGAMGSPDSAGMLLVKHAVRDQAKRSGRRDESAMEHALDRCCTWGDVEVIADELRIAARIVEVSAQRRERA